MEENAEEGVEVEVADMSEIDNSECIELMEAKPHGILSVLNEECVVPRGSDASFAARGCTPASPRVTSGKSCLPVTT